VTFSPGRARLATSPLPNGSPTLTMTMGIVRVARLAARDACVTTVTMTSTLSRTRSAARSGSRSNILPHHQAKFAEGVTEGREKGLIGLLPLGGQRRGEETACQSPDERTPVH